MYPFNEDYKTPILAFIAKLNTHKGLRINTTATATTVTGEYAQVMRTLTELFEWSHATHGKAVYVAKFIPGYEPE
jgi:uncharacterized protein YqgV (UPF0045/DUF77 family)